MLGGDDSNPMLPFAIDENRLQYQINTLNRLQLFESFPSRCAIDDVNYFGNEHLTPMVPPNTRGRETEDFLRQKKLPISMNYNICKEEARRSASIPIPNAVSTGLRLSYYDNERNSSMTSSSGSMTRGPSMILSLADNVTTELDCQKEEFDQYIKMQQEYLTKGIRDMKQRHMASFLAAVERGISKKLWEKDVKLEAVHRKNRELAERIKQVTMEAQDWHHRAKYSESVVNVLKTNLQQVISQSQGAEQLGKEGFGDSEVDCAASYIDPNNFLRIPVGGSAKCVSGNQHGMICRACKAKQVMKTAGFQVYLS